MSSASKHFYKGAYYVRPMPNHSSLKSTMLNLISSAKSHSLNTEEEVIGRCDYEFMEEQRDWVDVFSVNAYEALRTLPWQWMLEQPEILSIWFQQYETSGYHTWHNHGRCSYSAVYFLELGNPNMATQFITPYWAQGQSPLEQFAVQEGDIVIFPSGLIHRSAQNSGGRKTSIAMNLDFMGDYRGAIKEFGLTIM